MSFVPTDDQIWEMVRVYRHYRHRTGLPQKNHIDVYGKAYPYLFSAVWYAHALGLSYIEYINLRIVEVRNRMVEPIVLIENLAVNLQPFERLVSTQKDTPKRQYRPNRYGALQ